MQSKQPESFLDLANGMAIYLETLMQVLTAAGVSKPLVVDIAIKLSDSHKSYAAEYHRLVTEGKIPPEMQLRIDPMDALTNMELTRREMMK